MKRYVIVIATVFLLTMAGTAKADIIGGIEFLDGEAAFADAWIYYMPGPGAVGDYVDPSLALGIPDYDGAAVGHNHTSLGNGGELILQFIDNSLTTSGNAENDLWIFEVGPAVEPTSIFVSTDNSNWVPVGATGGSTRGIDIDAYIGAGVVLGERYSFVKLIDDNRRLSDYPFAGADIDAIGAISSAPAVVNPVPEPGTLALFASGGLLLGLVRLRKRAKKK